MKKSLDKLGFFFYFCELQNESVTDRTTIGKEIGKDMRHIETRRIEIVIVWEVRSLQNRNHHAKIIGNDKQ